MIPSPFGCANKLLRELRRRDMSLIGDFSHLARFQNGSVRCRSGLPTGLLDLCIHALGYVERRDVDPGILQCLPDPTSNLDRARRVAVNAHGTSTRHHHLPVTERVALLLSRHAAHRVGAGFEIEIANLLRCSAR